MSAKVVSSARGRSAGRTPGPGQGSVDEPVRIREAWCKRCDICVQFCPKAVLARDEQGAIRVVDPAACSLCRLCEQMCPDFAITVREGGEVARKGRGKTDARERSLR